MTRAPNGWRRQARKFKAEPIGPLLTQWERFLYANRIEEQEIMAALRSDKAKLIADWIRPRVGSVYVPEKVLKELGIETRWIA